MTDRKLTANEKVQLIRQVFSLLKLLTEEEALVGAILSQSSFYQIRTALATSVEQYKPSGLELDPQCENSFVVNGVLFLKGTGTIQ